MASITVTFIDTPTGGVAIKHDFVPRAGAPCSPAQNAALDVINRTAREYGLTNAQAAQTKPESTQ